MNRFLFCSFCRFFIFYCLAHSLWANPKFNTTTTNGNWYIKGGIGATFPQLDSNDYVSAGLGWPNDKYSYNHASSDALLSISGGYTWNGGSVWLPFYSLGLNYTYAFPYNVKGEVVQYSLPEFTNYDFEYKIHRQTLLVIAKADIYRWCNIMPFLTAGAGVSWNRAYDYEENAKPNVTPRVSPGFKDRTSTHASYLLGAGLDYRVNNCLWVSMEYNYGYFVNAQTGSGVDTTMLTGNNFSNMKLKTKLTENTIFISLNYFFDGFVLKRK